MSQVSEIKRLRAEGESIREISRQLGVSRNTVRSYVRGKRVPGEYRLEAGRPRPVSDRLRPFILKLLEAERASGAPRKQRLTAARVFRVLRDRGCGCERAKRDCADCVFLAQTAESTIRRLVREVRFDLRDPLEHAFVPLEYDPGVDAQVDFFEGVVDDREQGRIKQHFLVVRACYSGRSFVYAAPNQTREALLEGLMRSFEHFGGVFRKYWFDNLTPVVQKVLKGRKRKLQRDFESFQAHYGFEAEFCAPARGNEKGGVEGAVKFSRHEILSPIPTVTGRDQVQALCADFMKREERRRIRGKERTIAELFEEESSRLFPLPFTRFEAYRSTTARVSSHGWVSIDTNYYSVPVEWVGRRIDVKVGAEDVLLFHRSGEQVVQKRLYGRKGLTLELDHYLPLLQRKHRALERAIPLKRFLESQDPCWAILLRELLRKEGNISGGKAFIDILFSCRKHSIAKVEEAVKRALGEVEFSPWWVSFYLSEGEPPKDGSAALLKGPDSRSGSPAAYLDLLTDSKEDK